ncbi:ATP-grasp domain-containing protein [Bacillus wiedmannii]|uniref:ATP-grasp domain-containing protein n=1 Tax=Bacillus wiedmannii TaxID=1890302 RepID=UPI000BF3B96C|nr:ATP-grasp domain-containing protein [Bacillus wiedmannii]PFZ92293.1 hypothetical protein COL83_17005 [Bacillus wiedmannii]
MTVLILNRFPKKRKDYIEWFKDINEEIIMFGVPETIDDFPEVKYRKSYIDMENNGQLDWDAVSLFNEKPFQTILALQESQLIRAGRLRTLLGLKGQSHQSAVAYRNKIIMKKRLKQSKEINIAPFRKIEDPVDLFEFTEKYGYPIVIKPIHGFDSRNTQIFYNQDQLYIWLRTDEWMNNRMVEKYIEGTMYHVNGIVINGEIKFSCVFSYIDNCLSYLEAKGVGHALLEYENPLRALLIKNVEKVIEILPTPDLMTFHAEYFYTKENEIVLCEIASRTAGGSIPNLIFDAFNIDLDRYISRAQLGVFDPIPDEKKSLASSIGNYLVPPKEGILKSYPDKLPFNWVTKYERKRPAGRRFENINNSFQHYAIVHVKGKNEKEVRERIGIAVAYIENHTTWEIL